MLRGIFYPAPSLSLEGGPISGLYSWSFEKSLPHFAIADRGINCKFYNNFSYNLIEPVINSLFSEASNHRTNSGVHTIGLSSFHLPWISANLVDHSYSSMGKVEKMISCIFIYKYLFNHSSFEKRRISIMV